MACLRMDWDVLGRDSTRIMIHLADWPCHGTAYHDGVSDNYPDGDPRGLDSRT